MSSQMSSSPLHPLWSVPALIYRTVYYQETIFWTVTLEGMLTYNVNQNSYSSFFQSTYEAGLAQSVERQALNLMVEGSSPSFGVFLFCLKWFISFSSGLLIVPYKYLRSSSARNYTVHVPILFKIVVSKMTLNINLMTSVPYPAKKRCLFNVREYFEIFLRE
jgi:hypothetical protein